jgi:Leucine-rich repeat (LRR) protein
MRKPVLLAVLVLISMGTVDAQVPSSERNALIALYTDTNGSGWTNNSGWLGWAGTECDWYGVSCDAGEDHVVTLALINNGLSGTIPSEIEDLASLTRLRLSSNQLTGSIPSELENIPPLKELWLSDNQLSGSIPPELGNLSSLEELILSNNGLTGSIPPQLGNLSNLEYLVLGFNQLSGTIPPQLGDLTSLESGLQLNDNELTGNIPPELGNLVNLERLLLQHNQLSGTIPPELGDLVSLEQLWLHDNQLEGSIPAELANPPALEKLYLQLNQITGSIPAELGSATALTDLILSHNRLGGTIPSELGDMAVVRTLYLASNQLHGEIPVELGNLSTLSDLDLTYNALYSDDAALVAFLNGVQIGGNWQSTQTVAPESPTITQLGDHTVWLSWTPTSYQMDPGGSVVFSGPTGSGVWTSGGWTESKMISTFPVTALAPGATYDLAVATFTDPHTSNQNLVTSDLGPPVMATTASTGCGQPAIKVTGAGPYTLSLFGSYDSYEWSTGETTPSIVVNPPSEQWYWVSVTSAGPCEEAAVISVAQMIVTDIFSDGFESGNMNEWSSSVP